MAARDENEFLSGDEAIQLANQYLNEGRYAEVIALTKATRVVFPQAVSAYGVEAMAHMFSGNTEAAQAIVAQADGLVPGLPWEGRMMDSLRARLEQ